MRFTVYKINNIGTWLHKKNYYYYHYCYYSVCLNHNTRSLNEFLASRDLKVNLYYKPFSIVVLLFV